MTEDQIIDARVDEALEVVGELENALQFAMDNTMTRRPYLPELEMALQDDDLHDLLFDKVVAAIKASEVSQ